MTSFCAHCNQDSKRPAYYLPMDVVPHDDGVEPVYRVFLTADIEGPNPHFHGEAFIKIEVLNSVVEFPINAADLELSDVMVLDSTGASLKPSLREDLENERVFLSFEQPLALGVGTLQVKWNGKFNPLLKGFYLSGAIGPDGEEAVVGSTQSQPADFRRWVPSFDQPGPTVYKATLSMTVEIDEHLVARSNGAVLAEERLGNGKKRVYFAKTNKLPTYVFAVVVGLLESSDPIDVGGVEVRVWATPGKKHLMTFALEVIKRGLPLLEECHGQKYPNPKLDIIAIPEFEAGAMEDDGMFMFREIYALVDKEAATVMQLLMVAVVLLHEADHTWDGNRHTMVDWSQLSLNEARATFMSYLIADILFPQFDVWTKFAHGRAEAMSVDGLWNTRAVVSPIERLDQCRSVFDVITYQKGAAVLRQLQTCLDTLRRDGFRDGMQHFNRLFDWGNASTEELWVAIGDATQFDVRGLMDTWTLQQGFPVICVRRASKQSITLSQRRFTYLAAGETESEQLWRIPIFIRARRGDDWDEQLVFLNDIEHTFDLGEEFDCVVVNAGGHGFYRVLYESNLLQSVTASQKELGAVERFNLLGDAWAFLRCGKISARTYLGLVREVSGDRDPNLWQEIAGSLTRLLEIASESEKQIVRAFITVIAQPVLDELGLKGSPAESPQTTELRGIVLLLLGRTNDPSIVSLCRHELFGKWLQDRTALDGDVFAAALKTAAGSGDEQFYDELFALLQAGSLNPQQENVVVEALACFPQEALAVKTLGKMLSKEIKLQMAARLLGWLLQNARVRGAVWQWLKAHFEAVQELVPKALLVRGLEGVALLDGPGDVEDVRSFLEANGDKLRGFEQRLAQTLESQSVNQAFRARGLSDKTGVSLAKH